MLPIMLAICLASYKWMNGNKDVWQQACLPAQQEPRTLLPNLSMAAAAVAAAEA